MTGIMPYLLAAGTLCFGASAWLGWRSSRRDNGWLMLLGAAVFALAIAIRWQDLGQGPFLTMHEILLSNLFSLALVFGIACRVSSSVCSGSAIAGSVLLVLAAWLFMTDPEPTPLPATYGNPWLWVHVILGKLFLGACLVASSLAAYRLTGFGPPGVPDTGEAESMWRWLAVAFVFHSGMLIAGAVWAQDAWGRYWAWDPLETWAFATWLAMAFVLHARVTLTLSAKAYQWMIVGIFVLAFLTFFGVPFVSIAPHKGAV